MLVVFHILEGQDDGDLPNLGRHPGREAEVVCMYVCVYICMYLLIEKGQSAQKRAFWGKDRIKRKNDN